MQDQVARKVALTEEVLQDAIDAVRAAATQAFPNGLPDDCPFSRALESSKELAEAAVKPSDLLHLQCSASKIRGQRLQLPCSMDALNAGTFRAVHEKDLSY